VKRSPVIDPVRITSASQGRSVSRRGRERRYLASMLVRVLCLVGAVLLDDPWLRGLLLVGAVFLPYVAVIAANEDTRPDGRELRPLERVDHQLPAPGRS
jgi:hypothetical protein